MRNTSKRATIYDVAAEAGVSITTVSRYMNDPTRVGEGTGKKIAEAVEILDYVRQGNAGSRQGRRVGRIGVLTPFFPAPSFVERLRGTITPLKEQNYEVVIYTIESPEQLDEYLNSVPFTRRIDGLILMSVNLSPEQHRTLQASELPVVMVESDDEHYSRVLADDYAGGRLAAELFIRKDYLPCLFMGDRNRELSYSCHPSEMRQKGFREGLAEAGYRLPEDHMIFADTTVEDARRVFSEYLSQHEAPRAVFAMCDLQAIGFMRAAREKGISIPEQTAVLGFDDIDTAEWMDLSTISQHLGDSGRVAAGLLLDFLSGKSETIQKINLQVSMIERSTT